MFDRTLSATSPNAAAESESVKSLREVWSIRVAADQTENLRKALLEPNPERTCSIVVVGSVRRHGQQPTRVVRRYWVSMILNLKVLL